MWERNIYTMHYNTYSTVQTFPSLRQTSLTDKMFAGAINEDGNKNTVSIYSKTQHIKKKKTPKKP